MLRYYGVLLILISFTASADDNDELNALSLANNTVNEVEHAKDWSLSVESAFRRFTQNNSTDPILGERLSFDFRYNTRFADNWRAVFADRIDLYWQKAFNNESTINSLKETYISWQADPNLTLDLGRINIRNGVSYSYNPTDYFKVDANRSIISNDPASQRENRQGVAVYRNQFLWNTGSVTALYSPKLENKPNTSSFNPDFGATNNSDRWLVSVSQRFSENFNPQLLVFQSNKSPQLGLNLTTLINSATVINFEYSGGYSASLADQAFSKPDNTNFRSKLNAGFTFTTKDKLSLIMEYQYNGAGMDNTSWHNLRNGPLQFYGIYRQYVVNTVEIPTQQNVFLYAKWEDMLIQHLDFTAMLRIDIADGSQFRWVEARYHWPKVDMALQVQLNGGSNTSDYGSPSMQPIGQLLVRCFF